MCFKNDYVGISTFNFKTVYSTIFKKKFVALPIFSCRVMSKIIVLRYERMKTQIPIFFIFRFPIFAKIINLSCHKLVQHHHLLEKSLQMSRQLKITDDNIFIKRNKLKTHKNNGNDTQLFPNKTQIKCLLMLKLECIFTL